MSPTRRGTGGVAGLQRGAGTKPLSEKRVSEMTDDEVRQLATPAVRTKPVRITLDLDPALYKELTGWANEAAAKAELPRLSLARSLRAMIRVTLADHGIAAVVVDQARHDSED